MKNRVPQIIQRWVGLISEGSPEKQTSLYSTNAILLATFEPMLLGQEQIFGYMLDFLDKKNMQCEILENVLQVDYDRDTKIASGIYLFSFDNTDNGQREMVVARYTFVINEDKIINHHSSVMPEDD